MVEEEAEEVKKCNCERRKEKRAEIGRVLPNDDVAPDQVAYTTSATRSIIETQGCFVDDNRKFFRKSRDYITCMHTGQNVDIKVKEYKSHRRVSQQA